MTTVLPILWFIWLLVSIVAVRDSHGSIGLTSMFPEGYRPWHSFYQIAALLNFAAAVHFHPFTL